MKSVADVISPDVRARLRHLRVDARHASGLRGVGLHQSRSRGAGLEFAQYRTYEPGDELRQVDWKLYARSDRFFVREAERESPLAIWLLVDTTASMAQQDAARPGWSRLAAATGLVACIAEVALRQGDRFGMIALGGEGLRVVAPTCSARQRDRLLLELRGMQPHGRLPADGALDTAWSRIRAGDLVVLLSDLYDERIVEAATRLAAARRDVVAIRILTAEERDFPFQGGHRFTDPETADEVLGDGTAMRADFLERFGAARRALDGRLDAAGIRHSEYVLDQPLDEPLQRLFGAAGTARRA